MRIFRTGTDAEGRSCILSVSEHSGAVAERVSTALLETPLAAREPGQGEFMDVNLQPGTTSWRLVELLPDQELPWHKTRSVDVDVVVTGSVRFGVERETVELSEGDVVIVDGVLHRWNVGPEGCRLLAALIAVP
jgi:quercetin dioxygenase-like cupin family protein